MGNAFAITVTVLTVSRVRAETSAAKFGKCVVEDHQIYFREHHANNEPSKVLWLSNSWDLSSSKEKAEAKDYVVQNRPQVLACCNKGYPSKNKNWLKHWKAATELARQQHDNS